MILDPDAREIISVTVALEQLQESFQSAQPAHDCGRDQACLLVRDFQTVAFILIERGNDVAGPFALDYERRCAFIGCQVRRQRHTSDAGAQTVVCVAPNRYFKTAVDREAARLSLDRKGRRHQVELNRNRVIEGGRLSVSSGRQT